VRTGRVPHPRHRVVAAKALEVPEAVLWPTCESTARGVGELVGLYPTRAELSPAVVRSLLEDATSGVDVLAYSGLWLWDAVPNFTNELVAKALSGVAVRVCLGDPDSDAVRKRGEEEGIGDGMAARCRLALSYAEILASRYQDSVRCTNTTLYTSILRFDDDVFLNVHLWGNAASTSPVMHLRLGDESGVATNAMMSFERVWKRAQPPT